MPETKEVAEFQKKFDLVQIGDSETKVVSVLGTPEAKEKEFRLGQKEGFEVAYARAEANDSFCYLFWFKGFDVVFAVGINNKGKVSAKKQVALNKQLVPTPGTAHHVSWYFRGRHDSTLEQNNKGFHGQLSMVLLIAERSHISTSILGLLHASSRYCWRYGGDHRFLL